MPVAPSWVAEQLGQPVLRGSDASQVSLTDLVGVGLRHNARRAQLLVSTVLGKHIPTDPLLVYGSGRLLGLAVAGLLRPEAVTADDVSAGLQRLRAALDSEGTGTGAGTAAGLLALCDRSIVGQTDGTDAPTETVVLGYAETATALGHAVADQLGADYLHSTRRPVPGLESAGIFAEEHSHATSHWLLPEDPAMLRRGGPLVLVDDELSTGQTALNTITGLHRQTPRAQYLIAALVDLRSAKDRARMAAAADQLGTRIDVVAIACGTFDGPDEALQQLAARHQAPVAATRSAGSVRRVLSGWPVSVPDGGRHGFTIADRHRAGAAAQECANAVLPDLRGNRVHVLGFEELMFAPLLIACALQRLLNGCISHGDISHGDIATGGVTISATTRSPVLALDEPGYPLRTALSFPSHDDPSDGPGLRYAYNVRPAIGSAGFSDIVLVVDDAADTPQLWASGGLLEQLSGCAEQVHVVVLPSYRPIPAPLRGPAFGSYAATEVGWLLTDLSTAEIEAPIQEREEAIQTGGHYAESLPIEYQPSPEYQQLYTDALTDSASRLAHAVGMVTELVLAERGPGVVLASLARAGTPVGILMRRWAQFEHGLDLPHYAVSIVRGRGIDTVALKYLRAHHQPGNVVFVDGWTGKGAIARELTAAIEEVNRDLAPGSGFVSDLAVLADPGFCVSTFGTREDYLIPSACLNSTVSGLVSRTVLNRDLIAPGQFHGAKFYRHLQDVDCSHAFLDAVSDCFGAVRAEVAQGWPVLAASDRAPTWAGASEVHRLATAYGLADVNLIKPGVGETTRVLLRRVPWKILMRADAVADLAHVALLAKQRGVEVAIVADLAYRCVGLIHPDYTRTAVGANGLGTVANAGAVE